MGRKGHSPEQIVQKLREAEVALASGSTVAQAVRQIGISEQTYYRWRNLYGKMEMDQLRRLKTLEVENRRLKKIVTDQALDLQIVKEAIEGKY
jgi:transposase-like protein